MTTTQTPSTRYSVKPVPVMSGDPMFQVVDGLHGVTIGRYHFWSDDAEKIAVRMNLLNPA
jgi:hypothetical protein